MKFIVILFSVGARYTTHAVNIFKYTTKIDGKLVEVEFWDTGFVEKYYRLNLNRTLYFSWSRKI